MNTNSRFRIFVFAVILAVCWTVDRVTKFLALTYLPVYRNYGMTFDMTWKGFTLSMVFTGVYGNQIANGNRYGYEDMLTTGNLNNISKRAFYNSWDMKPDEAATSAYPRFGYTGSNYDFTSFLVEDGSYLRFSVLSLGYNFRFKNRKPITGVGITLTARNLFVWSNYTGYDPEVNSFPNTWNKVGVDWASYPGNRSYSLGITLDF